MQYTSCINGRRPSNLIEKSDVMLKATPYKRLGSDSSTTVLSSTCRLTYPSS